MKNHNRRRGSEDESNTTARYSRREIIASVLAVPAIALIDRCDTFSKSIVPSISGPKTDPLFVTSPSGRLHFEFSRLESEALGFQVLRGANSVIETSRFGFIVDKVNLCQRVRILKVEKYKSEEHYAIRGPSSVVATRANGARIFLESLETSEPFSIDVRAFDDAIAFRYLLPPSGRARTPDECGTFAIPSDSLVWHHDFEGHYEGVHKKSRMSEIETGVWAAMPLTAKLSKDAGYVSITEGALESYSGAGLLANGKGAFEIRLAHDLPVSYPFRLRYGADEAERLKVPAQINGPITTPWRIVMVASNLNDLVNCNAITAVSPPPDKSVFPEGIHTEWIKPGRAVWKYLDGGENTLEGMKRFSFQAGQLGFEYNVVEGFWQKWTIDELRDLVSYSRKQGVGIWLWKHSKDLRTEENRREFFELTKTAGVVGAKIDFFDHEAKEIIDLYRILLKEAAEARVMLDFHGANKPTGEVRSWPNELSREAVRGLEASKMEQRSTHNTTLPFTRMLAGHADYTPMHFGDRRKETSWAHQIATATIFTSELLVFAANPDSILSNPALKIIRQIPATWDETIALPFSEIGEVAGFARRTGDSWFVAIINGLTARSVDVGFSFAGSGKFTLDSAHDDLDNAASVTVGQGTYSRDQSLNITMRSGGGFIGILSPMKPPSDSLRSRKSLK